MPDLRMHRRSAFQQCTPAGQRFSLSHPHQARSLSQIYVYGVSSMGDGACVTQLIQEYDAADAKSDARKDLKEMCFRILLLVQRTLDAVEAASHYDGRLPQGAVIKSPKNAPPKSPTSDPSPGGACCLLSLCLRLLS